MKTRKIQLALLYRFCDKLITTQIIDSTDFNNGALVSPDTNPSINPIHTRSGEAVFPLAVAYQQSKNPQYKASAVLLANWLINNQLPGGAWKEPPWHWKGTTANALR